MDLLEKFESVRPDTNTRISGADRAFCEAHQAAYENALATLQELGYFWDDMVAQQEETLSPVGTPPCLYLLSQGDLKISGDAIRGQLKSLHALFIGQLVSHFSKTYHISISAETIEEKLLPVKPPDKWTAEARALAEKYSHEPESLSLRYNDILELILFQTGGRAFADQALYELKESCLRAAWDAGKKRADYTRKNCTIQFTHYACNFRSYYRASGSWDLSEKMKAIVKGLAHFETGGFPDSQEPFTKLAYGRFLDSNEYSFSGCQKIQSMKLFKNGRADIRFSTESYAIQFVEGYLGTACPT